MFDKETYLKEKELEMIDKIAIKAMQSLLVNAGDDYISQGIAIMAYDMAKEMMEERKKYARF